MPSSSHPSATVHLQRSILRCRQTIPPRGESSEHHATSASPARPSPPVPPFDRSIPACPSDSFLEERGHNRHTRPSPVPRLPPCARWRCHRSPSRHPFCWWYLPASTQLSSIWPDRNSDPAEHA